jgi:hypothetical protein
MWQTLEEIWDLIAGKSIKEFRVHEQRENHIDSVTIGVGDGRSLIISLGQDEDGWLEVSVIDDNKPDGKTHFKLEETS